MTPGISISVALVTCNRPESLRRCLASLRAQDAQPFETVVSDDSDEGFAPAVRELAEQYHCRYMRGPRRGLYANRNAAALACTGTQIRTMDDDHTFPPGHFAQCLDAVHSDPRAIWTTGEARLVSTKILDRFNTALQLHASGVAHSVENPDDNWAIADGSTIYPAEIFHRGFRMVDEFQLGSGYLEFGALLYRHGWKSRCVNGAVIEHHIDAGSFLSRDPASQLFACICFNLHFRPSSASLLRHVSPILARNPGLIAALPRLLKLARDRWSNGGVL